MRLLNIRILTPTFRRSVWIRWLPPIDMASPSPVCDPHFELRTGHLEARRYRRRPPVDRVEAEGVHVVGETAGAADAGDHHELLHLGIPSSGKTCCTARGSHSPRSRGTSGPPGRSGSLSWSGRVEWLALQLTWLTGSRISRILL